MKVVLPSFPAPQIKDWYPGEVEQCLQPDRKEGKREYGKNRVVSKREMGKEGISSAGEERRWKIWVEQNDLRTVEITQPQP